MHENAPSEAQYESAARLAQKYVDDPDLPEDFHELGEEGEHEYFTRYVSGEAWHEERTNAPTVTLKWDPEELEWTLHSQGTKDCSV